MNVFVEQDLSFYSYEKVKNIIEIFEIVLASLGICWIVDIMGMSLGRVLRVAIHVPHPKLLS